MDIHLLDTLIVAGLFATLALSLNIIVGYAGVLSIAHAAFFGIGAYSTAILTTRFGIEPILAVATGCIVSAILAGLMSLPAARIRGDYLLVATLGFGEIVRLSFRNRDNERGSCRPTGRRETLHSFCSGWRRT